MAFMSNQIASSLVSSSSTPQWKYDVFLSFRGEDTRNKFTDHLYAALNQKGIVVFRDDEKLARGKAVAPELLKAIAESRFSIVIFSRNYASSTWCLDELVQIVECMVENGQVVLPIFYDVDPSEVRKQAGSFQKDFAKHEQVFRENIKKVEEWRTAMTEVANLSGWHIQDRPEAKLIQEIVKEILCKSYTLPRVVDVLVGIDSRVKKLNSCLGEGLNDVRFIGICGMGGIGKTTIAKVVYESLSHQFESSCFLKNVREVFQKLGPVPLQNQILSEVLMEPNIDVLNDYKGVEMIRSRLRNKMVLLILDDVDNSKQLNMLAEDRSWFGPGSRIIITTRDEHLLREHEVGEIFKAEELDVDESLTLFSRKAFKLYHPVRDYDELSKRVVNYANGLPLALEVLGSFLYGRSVDVWKSALDRLDKFPSRDILDILQVSFDGLQELERKIFLDIACFFKGSDKDHVIKILDACGFYPDIGIQVLVDKSLLKILENNLWMHDLLQIMGQEIVRRESIEEPGKRSRLWVDDNVNHVLTKNTGTNSVEAIDMRLLEHQKAQWNADSFLKMSKLRLLRIHNVHLYQGPNCLLNELRFLEWHNYPSKCLPFSFHPDKLVELSMYHSRIKQLWKRKKDLKNLKFITLSHSKNLTETPDFTGIPNLERLILEHCTRLCEVHPSIGLLRKLIFLNLKHCNNLRSLPSNIQMESLEIFILSGCSKLRKFPEIIGKMEALSKLHLDGTAIQELPSSIERLRGLVLLDLGDCKNLVRLLDNINVFKSLKILNLSGCFKLENVPENLEEVECLEKLDISGTALRQPPSAIFFLKNLKELSFHGCKGPPSNSRPFPFTFLSMQRKSLEPMPLILPSLSGLCSITNLDLSDCNLGEGAIPNDIGCLSSLEELNLSNNNFVSLPTSISQLSRLYNLNVKNCKRLQSVPKLSLVQVYVEASDCTSMKGLPDTLKRCIKEEPMNQVLGFCCPSCFKLEKNQACSSIATRMLKRYLQGVSNLRQGLNIIIPGNKISEWFSYQAEGNKVTIQKSSVLNDKNKLIGLALCYNFVVHQHPPVLSCDCFSGTYYFELVVEDDNKHSLENRMFSFNEKLGRAFPVHLWLLYFPLKTNPWLSDVDEASHIGISVRPYVGPGLEVKKLGVHLIYEQDVVELNQTMNQFSTTTSFENFNGLPQDFDGSALDDAMIKRINDEAGPSGNDCFEDEQHPIRFKY